MCGVMVASFIAYSYSFLSFILLFVPFSNKGKHEVSSQNRKISSVNEKRCVLYVACKESQAQENVIFQPWKERKGGEGKRGGGRREGKRFVWSRSDRNRHT
jgi:hypothetical protein